MFLSSLCSLANHLGSLLLLLNIPIFKKQAPVSVEHWSSWLSMRQRGRGTAWKLLSLWGSTMVNISGAEERMGKGSVYQQFILYRMCSSANSSDLGEFSLFLGHCCKHRHV